jgi:hypothetical protein
MSAEHIGILKEILREKQKFLTAIYETFQFSHDLEVIFYNLQ